MRILVVGQAPARNQGKDPKPWSDAASSRRLWEWFGCKDYKEFISKHEPYYACPWLEGIMKKGDRVPSGRGIIKLLRHRLNKHVMTKYPDQQLVFLVGKFAQRVADYLPKKQNLCESFDMKGMYITFVAIPHPSGVNREVNGMDKKIKKYVADMIKSEQKKEEEYASSVREPINGNKYNECGVESCAICPARPTCSTYNREE